MKKTLLLLSLLISLFSSSRAEEVTLFSAEVTTSETVAFVASSTTEISSEWATIAGGTMYAINGQTSAKDLIKAQKSAPAFSITNNNTYFKVVLNNALQAGDVINADGISRDDVENGIWISTSESRPNSCDAALTCDIATAAWTALSSYTIPEGSELVDATTIYIYRSVGKTVYFNNLTITRSSDLTNATLSFSSTTASATLGETFTAPTLTVTPTEAASEVVYSSSNTNVATVDATGAVTLIGGGSTTITAAIANSVTYTSASASYTLNVTDPNVTSVTATWPFNTGAAGQRATIDVANVFSIDAVEVADMTYAGVASDQDVTGTKMQPISQASDDGSQYVKFTLTPKKGINFRPTSISFDAMRWGTDGSNKLHYYVEAGSTSVELGNVNPNRNGKGNGWSHYEHEISGVTCTKDAPFALACYVYGLANNKQISFANITVTGTFDGEAEDETMYSVSTGVNIEGAGTVTQSPAGTSLTEGTEVTFTATANTGYTFLNKWTVNDTEVSGEEYTITSLSEDTEVIAQFKKLYAIAFSAGDGDKGTTSYALETEYAEETYTTPAANYYVSKEGYTATGWTDGTNEYGFGEAITLTGDITLSPIFVENTVSLTETPRNEDLVVTWDFTGTPALNIEKATGYYVNQVLINDNTLDVPMYINNASTGKTNNVSRESDTQVNAGSSFTIPAMNGMTVVLTATSEISETTVGGNAPTSGSGTTTATYVYEGTDATVEISIQDGKYYKSIVVTYPATQKEFELAIGNLGWASFYDSSNAYSIPTGLTAYYVEAISGSTLNLRELEDGIIPADFGVVLEATAGNYTLTSTTDVDTKPENLLRGTDSDALTTGDDENATYLFYALSAKNDVVGFYWMNSDGSAFTNNAHKAYLAVKQEESNGANAYTLDGTNGIEQTTINSNTAVDAPAYNLAGQRVSSNYKGIVIVNDKKILRK